MHASKLISRGRLLCAKAACPTKPLGSLDDEAKSGSPPAMSLIERVRQRRSHSTERFTETTKVISSVFVTFVIFPYCDSLSYCAVYPPSTLSTWPVM
jgi:hypothetical protein